MDQTTHIVSFIWGIDDDVLRDLKSRGSHAVSFTRHFYKPKPLRTLEEIGADIVTIEEEAQGLLAQGGDA